MSVLEMKMRLIMVYGDGGCWIMSVIVPPPAIISIVDVTAARSAVVVAVMKSINRPLMQVGQRYCIAVGRPVVWVS